MNGFAPALEKPPKRPVGRQRLDQLDFGRPYRHEGHRRVLPRQDRSVPDGEAECQQRNGRLRVEIADDDRKMREAARGAAHRTADGR